MIRSLRGLLTCTLLSRVIRPAASAGGNARALTIYRVGVLLRRYQHITSNTGVNREWKPGVAAA